MKYILEGAFYGRAFFFRNVLAKQERKKRNEREKNVKPMKTILLFHSIKRVLVEKSGVQEAKFLSKL